MTWSLFLQRDFHSKQTTNKMKKLILSVALLYNLFSTFLQLLINRLGLDFKSIRIHTLRANTFLIDFTIEMLRIPVVPFLSIRFSDLRLLTVEGDATICNISLNNSISLNSAIVEVKDGRCTIFNETIFNEFSLALLMETHFDFVMSGYVNLYLFSFIPLLPFSYIKLCKPINLRALDKLSQFEIGAVDVLGGTEEELEMSCEMTIYNDSLVSLDMGKSSVSLNMFYEGVYVGHCLISQFHLDRSFTRLVSRVFFSIECPLINEILSKYVQSKPLLFNIEGSENSLALNDCPLLKYAISQLRMSTHLPSLDCELISTAYLSLLSTNPLTLTTSSFMDVYNPFEANIVIYGIEANVCLSGELIGQIDWSVDEYEIRVLLIAGL